jgi:hypothetical protein
LVKLFSKKVAWLDFFFNPTSFILLIDLLFMPSKIPRKKPRRPSKTLQQFGNSGRKARLERISMMEKNSAMRIGQTMVALAQARSSLTRLLSLTDRAGSRPIDDLRVRIRQLEDRIENSTGVLDRLQKIRNRNR